MFYDDHKTVLMNGWIICRFVEISEVSGDFLLDFALNMFLEKFTQLFMPAAVMALQRRWSPTRKANSKS